MTIIPQWTFLHGDGQDPHGKKFKRFIKRMIGIERKVKKEVSFCPLPRSSFTRRLKQKEKWATWVKWTVKTEHYR